MSSTLWDTPQFDFVGYEPLTPEEERQARKECIEALEQLLEQGRLIQRERLLRKEWEQTPAERECRERIQRIREYLEGE